jgi:hypothetical protein
LNRCRFCGGNDFCQHGRIKRDCGPCYPNNNCKHRKTRKDCPICSKTICAHGFNIAKCKTCKQTKEDDWWFSDEDTQAPQALQAPQAPQAPQALPVFEIFPGSQIFIGDRVFMVTLPAFGLVIVVVPGQQLPSVLLTFENSMWRIPAGSVIRLPDGNFVFLHSDAFGYQLASPPALPQTIPYVVPENLPQALQPDNIWDDVPSSSDSEWNITPLSESEYDTQ